jgi:hypothetical protein
MIKGLGLILLAWPMLAAPNFTGDWKLNTSKSDFGPMPAPTSMSSKITHDDPQLKTATKQSGEQGEFEIELKYTTDGKEVTNTFMDSPMKSTAKWDGAVLVIDTKANFGGNDVTIQDKWTLSEDGKVLTMNRHFSSSMGDADMKLVLEKQ